jgi:hypothetical protein
MPGVERSPIQPPNDLIQGLAKVRSLGPGWEKVEAGPQVHDPNATISRGDPGGSADLTRQPSTVRTPDHRFNVENAKMPQPPAATMPGRGDVPVDLRQYSQPATGMARQDTGKK